MVLRELGKAASSQLGQESRETGPGRKDILWLLLLFLDLYINGLLLSGFEVKNYNLAD
jgi:hypothetical protein